MMHILQESNLNKLETFWKQIEQGTSSTHKSTGLKYRKISIEELLPQDLIDPTQSKRIATQYKRKILRIREAHGEILTHKPTILAGKNHLSVKEYLEQILNKSPSQYLFNQLLTGDIKKEDIDKTPEYDLLFTELNRSKGIPVVDEVIAGTNKAYKVSASSSVDVHVTRLNEEMSLMSISGRPRTVVGPQVDHTTAYALFEYILKQAVANKPIEAAIASIIKVVEYTLPSEGGLNLDELLEEYKKANATIYNAILTEADLNDIATSSDKKISALHERLSILSDNAVQDYLSGLIEYLSNLFLTHRNQLNYVSFPKEGGVPAEKDEGPKIKRAMEALKKLEDEWSELNKKSIPESLDMSSTMVEKIVKQMMGLLFYPKINEKDLFDLRKPKDAEKWEKIKKDKNYRVNAQPRTNDLKLLSLVVKRHLSLIYACFEGFYNSAANFKAIEGSFIEKIADDWQLNPAQKTQLHQDITQSITALWREVDTKSATDDETTSGTHSRSSSTDDDTKKDRKSGQSLIVPLGFETTDLLSGKFGSTTDDEDYSPNSSDNEQSTSPAVHSKRKVKGSE